MEPQLTASRLHNIASLKIPPELLDMVFDHIDSVSDLGSIRLASRHLAQVVTKERLNRVYHYILTPMGVDKLRAIGKSTQSAAHNNSFGPSSSRCIKTLVLEDVTVVPFEDLDTRTKQRICVEGLDSMYDIFYEQWNSFRRPSPCPYYKTEAICNLDELETLVYHNGFHPSRGKGITKSTTINHDISLLQNSDDLTRAFWHHRFRVLRPTQQHDRERRQYQFVNWYFQQMVESALKNPNRRKPLRVISTNMECNAIRWLGAATIAPTENRPQCIGELDITYSAKGMESATYPRNDIQTLCDPTMFSRLTHLTLSSVLLGLPGTLSLEQLGTEQMRPTWPNLRHLSLSNVYISIHTVQFLASLTRLSVRLHNILWLAKSILHFNKECTLNCTEIKGIHIIEPPEEQWQLGTKAWIVAKTQDEATRTAGELARYCAVLDSEGPTRFVAQSECVAFFRGRDEYPFQEHNVWGKNW